MELRGDDLFIPPQKAMKVTTLIDGSILTIARSAPWPGFTPGLLSIILVVATQQKDRVLVFIKRCLKVDCFFVDKFNWHGAQ